MMMKPMGMSSAAAGGDKKGSGNGNVDDKKGGGGNEIPVQIKGTPTTMAAVRRTAEAGSRRLAAYSSRRRMACVAATAPWAVEPACPRQDGRSRWADDGSGRGGATRSGRGDGVGPAAAALDRASLNMRHSEKRRRPEDEEGRMTCGPTYEGQKGQPLTAPIANTTTQPKPTHKKII
jgi:hypothetical protein